MSSWKGKTRGNVLGYKIFVLTVKYFGLSPAYFLLRFVAFYFLFFSKKKYLFYFYNKILAYNKLNSCLKIYKNYYVFGQVLIDKIVVLSGFKKSFTIDFDGEHYLRQMTNGGILIGAHIGSWEIAGQLLRRLESRVNIIMYDEEHQKIKNYLSEVLQKKSVKIIPIKDDLSHVVQIKQALEKNELIVIHGDRFLENSRKISCNFLGQEAYFPTGPFYLPLKFDVPVAFVFSLKESKRHYHFYSSPPKYYKQPKSIKERNELIRKVIHDYVAELEKMVVKYPEQWFNFYDFWGISKK